MLSVLKFCIDKFSPCISLNVIFRNWNLNLKLCLLFSEMISSFARITMTLYSTSFEPGQLFSAFQLSLSSNLGNPYLFNNKLEVFYTKPKCYDNDL